MSEFKGTPGPWHYQVKSDAYTHIVRDPSGHRIVMYAPQSCSPETEANARLCAAAFDLLEALQMMVEQFTRTPSSLKDSEARVKAHAAIAKALGN